MRVQFRGPFWPPPPPFLVLEWHCKRSMDDFSTLCCNLYFLDDAVFQCGGGFFSRPLHLRLFVFPNMAPLPFCARACRWMCVDVKKKKKNQKKKKKKSLSWSIYEMFGKSRRPHSSKQHVKTVGPRWSVSQRGAAKWIPEELKNTPVSPESCKWIWLFRIHQTLEGIYASAPASFLNFDMQQGERRPASL